MRTTKGRFYRIELSGELAHADAVTISGAVTTRYAADVASVAAERDTAVVVLRWTGPDGVLAPGDVVTTDAPWVVGAPAKSATVGKVDDLGIAGAESMLSSSLKVAVAVGLVLATAILATRVR